MPDSTSPFDALSLPALRERKSSKWADVPSDVLPAWVAEMDVPLAPPIRDALYRAVEIGDTGYVPARPIELAEAFTQFASRRFDWALLPESVSIAPDVTSAIDRVLRLISRPGDPVAMFVPAYPPFYETVLGTGNQITALRFAGDQHGWHIDFDAVERAFANGARTLLLNNPHNPTGKVFTRFELERILELTCQHDVFVLSDEVHGALTLPGSKHTPWLCLGEEAARRGLVITAATKAFNLAGLKCGVIVAEGKVRTVVDRMPTEFRYMAGLLGAIASTAAFLHGGPWLDALLEHLDRNRVMLQRWLDPLKPRVGWLPPAGTYLAWLDLRASGLGPDPAQLILSRSRLALSRGQDFDPEGGSGWVRLNFGTTSAILDEILSRFDAAMIST